MIKLSVLTLVLAAISVGYCLSTGFSDESLNSTNDAANEDSKRRFMLINNDQQPDNYNQNVFPEPIECYSCIDCPEVLPNTTSKVCPIAYGSKQSTCVVFAEQYRQVMKTYYIRGCATERGSCAEITQVHSQHLQNDIVNLVFCEECEGDKCNRSGASRFYISITLLSAFVFLSKSSC